jgi:hypothetical protein
VLFEGGADGEPIRYKFGCFVGVVFAAPGDFLYEAVFDERAVFALQLRAAYAGASAYPAALAAVAALGGVGVDSLHGLAHAVLVAVLAVGGTSFDVEKQDGHPVEAPNVEAVSDQMVDCRCVGRVA